MTLLIFTLGPLFFSSLVYGNFSYDGDDGPSHWGDKYKTCLGKYQSPIDIEVNDVQPASFPPVEFSNVQSPHKANMTNNGHTVMIQIVDTDVPTVSGGPLNGSYVFQQLHFHWGQNDKIGSEDLINNKSFSMELHAVFWKKSYESSEEAMKHPDGLTVLAYLYESKDEPNPIFEPIVSQISQITSTGSIATIDDPNVLSKLVAPDIVSAQNYYTYRGSLTTPPCLEIVQWIDFIDPLSISHEQLEVFRGIQSSEGANLTHNFRPVQPLNDRTIYYNSISGNTETKPTSASATSTTSTTTTTAVPTEAKGTTGTTNAPTTVSITPMNKNGSQHSGQERIWMTSPLAMLFGIVLLLPYQ
ncbi:carbonic anhydrase 7-like [Hylaeus anthracinus]|uniref:carbonic anhydrase 7-like n=1 Tax=Hylaeus anthracinus TaxID=313031 RepID=UPI0023B97B8C|nr:carbonic anhydrase 7-like [Hylaeus anthracinus]